MRSLSARASFSNGSRASASIRFHFWPRMEEMPVMEAPGFSCFARPRFSLQNHMKEDTLRLGPSFFCLRRRYIRLHLLVVALAVGLGRLLKLRLLIAIDELPAPRHLTGNVWEGKIRHLGHNRGARVLGEQQERRLAALGLARVLLAAAAFLGHGYTRGVGPYSRAREVGDENLGVPGWEVVRNCHG